MLVFPYLDADVSIEYFHFLFGHTDGVFFRYPSSAGCVDNIPNADNIEHVPDIVTVLFEIQFDVHQLFLPVDMLFQNSHFYRNYLNILLVMP